MIQVCLILCHKNPYQLSLLLNQLKNNEIYIYIHLDKKANDRLFRPIVEDIVNAKIIDDRFNCGWGSYNLIRAILALIKTAFRDSHDCSHYHLISGEDVLIKSKNEFFSFFSSNKNTSYIKFFKLPYVGWSNGGLNRIYKYHIGNSKRHRYFIFKVLYKVINIVINRIIDNLLPFFKKKYDLQFYGGEMWWSLNKDAINAIVDYVQKNPDYIRFFKHSYIGDEIFIQSILLNSNKKLLIENDCLRYIDWYSPKKGSPAILSNNDYQKAINSNSFFARKIDNLKGYMFYNDGLL